MSIIDKISKEEFLNAYNSYPPNGWTKFGFKYFSKSTTPKDKWVSRVFEGVELLFFLLGFIGTVANWKHSTIMFFIWPFVALLVGVVVLMSGSAIMNNLRIRKIRKKLGITREEYEILASVYFE
jgi:hypothetical protein